MHFMEYVAIGTLFVNDINFADGQKKSGIIGGGGLFAFCGMLQYTDKALLLAGVGNDLEKEFGRWLNHNNVSREGLVIYNNHATLATMFMSQTASGMKPFNMALQILVMTQIFLIQKCFAVWRRFF